MKWVYHGFLAGIFFCLLTTSVDAASLYMDPSSVTLKRGDSVTVSIRIDTDEAVGECINAVSGVISYGAGIVPVDISTGESILSIWVEDPVIDEDNRTVTFAGGVPNGYCGRIQGDPRLTNNVIDLVFRSPGMQIGGSDVTETQIAFSDETQVFLNDGFGTQADLRTFSTNVTLSEDLGRGVDDEWLARVDADERPPEEFSIALERDDVAFSNKWFIVFNTEDKQTGIDHYEVIEESFADSGLFNWGAVDAPWVKTRSPYVLRDQTLNSTIRVKAIDKAGNTYIATLVPDADLRQTTNQQYIAYGLGAVGLLVLLGALAFVFMFWRNNRQYLQTEDPDKDDGN